VARGVSSPITASTASVPSSSRNRLNILNAQFRRLPLRMKLAQFIELLKALGQVARWPPRRWQQIVVVLPMRIRPLRMESRRGVAYDIGNRAYGFGGSLRSTEL